MEMLPRNGLTRAEMMKRMAFFKNLKGSDGGLPDSKMKGCIRTLYNVIGFQPPQGEGGAVIAGRRPCRTYGSDQDFRGVQSRLLPRQARQRADDAQSRHQRDIHPDDRHLAL